MAMHSKVILTIVFSLLVFSCAQDFISDIPCSVQTDCPKNYKCVELKCTPCLAGECNNGYYVQPGFDVPVSSHDFGSVQINTTKIDTIEVKYVAISGAPINVKGVIESGSNVFKVVNESFQELKKGSTLNLQVSYQPKALKADSGVLAITSNEPGGFTKKIKLSGTGVDPDIVVTPASIDFGSSFKNGPSKEEEVKIENKGNGPLEIKNIAFVQGAPVDFTLKNVPSAGNKIASNGSITFKVVFTPKTPGTLTTTLVIDNSDKDKPSIEISIRAYVSEECEPGYYDMNKDSSDGCECLGDKRGGSSCDKDLVKPVIAGENLPDTGGCVTVTGNLVPEDAEDWWTFIGVDTADVVGSATVGGDKYRISANFLANPDQLIFDVYKGCQDKDGNYREYCSGADCIPKKEDKKRNLEDGYNQKCDQFEFSMAKNTKLQGDTYMRGEEVCQLPVNNPQMADVNHCIDDTARYYIRVYRNKDSSGGIPISKSSCEKYILQICNGK